MPFTSKFEYERVDHEILRLRAGLVDLYRMEREAHRLVDQLLTIEPMVDLPDFEASAISIKAAIATRQAALDAFDERHEWGEHGVAYRVAS